MAKEPQDDAGGGKGRNTKLAKNTALLLGAAGLFLFIVGVKRRHRLDEEREIGFDDGPRARRRERERAEGGD
jgi:hypothetical protein